MLRRDSKARFECETVGFFKNKDVYRFHSGNRCLKHPLEEEEYLVLLANQQQSPICVMSSQETGKWWWMFQDKFYWENDDLTGEEVKALLIDRQRKDRRRIERAMSRLELEDADQPRQERKSISGDVKTFVWRRDGGQCVECGSREKLEFDHIIPISMGGSNTARNLQLLCETCNRSKGGDLSSGPTTGSERETSFRPSARSEEDKLELVDLVDTGGQELERRSGTATVQPVIDSTSLDDSLGRVVEVLEKYWCDLPTLLELAEKATSVSAKREFSKKAVPCLNRFTEEVDVESTELGKAWYAFGESTKLAIQTIEPILRKVPENRTLLEEAKQRLNGYLNKFKSRNNPLSGAVSKFSDALTAFQGFTTTLDAATKSSINALKRLDREQAKGVSYLQEIIDLVDQLLEAPSS